MIITQLRKDVKKNHWEFITGTTTKIPHPLVFVFADRFLLEDTALTQEIEAMFDNAAIIYGSSSAEILKQEVTQDLVTITAISLERSSYFICRANILAHDCDGKCVGSALAKKLVKDQLKHVFILSEGSYVNGSSLIEGLEQELPDHVAITGGLCADSDRFEKTIVGYNTKPVEGEIIAIGFYGETLEVSYANYGGWIPFGPEREITSSKANILYELDGIAALDLYKKYLGDKAKELPKAALLYPLRVTIAGKKNAVVRTILSIDEKKSAMVLAGDVPKGSKVQLMMATVDNIVEGAVKAAEQAILDRKTPPELAILISCIGRKLVMDHRVEEEVEEVVQTIGDTPGVFGFYSYGELAPFAGQKNCELHNQTMTLTLISE